MRKPSAAVLVALLVLSWIGFLASSPYAQEKPVRNPFADEQDDPQPALPMWEYAVASGNLNKQPGRGELAQEMKRMGNEGWELQTSVRLDDGSVWHTFKRQR